jgi:5-methylcytosine-specific restriction protein B
MSYNQTEQAFIEQVQSFENPEMVSRFLDLAKEMIEKLDLKNENQQLVCAILKESSKLPIFIGDRYVIRLKKSKDVFKLGFIIPTKEVDELKKDYGFLFSQNFDQRRNETIQKSFIDFDSNSFSPKEDFKQLWLETSKQELGKFSISPRRTYHHNDFFYKAILDRDYRDEILNKPKINYYLVGSYWDSYDPKDQTDRFVKEKIWQNGYEDRFIAEVKNIPINSRIAIKASFLKNNKSVLRIKAIGTVVENLNDGNNVKVDWDEDFKPFDTDFSGGYLKSLHELTKLDHIQKVFFFDSFIKQVETEAKSLEPMKFPLNLILYGPPGTGKTYSVKEKAVRVIEPDYQGDIDTKFKELKEAGQIEFVTFHQAFAYEEFIEGLSAETIGGQVSYKIKYGVFKTMAIKANANFLKAKIEKNNSIYLDFEETFEEFIAPLYENEDSRIRVEMIKGFFYITKIDEDTIHFEKQNGTSLHNLSKGILKSIYENKRVYRKDGLGVYYYPLVEKLRTISNSKPQKQEKLKNYVLIIDEINRANISKVFGELITLLEPSKRLGADDEHTVKLPYSQETFGVPQNLYLIGTMNTADRSIALLDIALRRRFEFEEMMPDIEKLKDKKIGEIELDKLLEKINQRIEFLLDRDHTIGHAYFLNISDLEGLAKAFLNKIIPLLQEYFYDNWEKISLVLSNQKTGDCAFLEVIDYQRNSLFKKVNSEMYLPEKKISFRVKSLAEISKAEFFRGIYDEVRFNL